MGELYANQFNKYTFETRQICYTLKQPVNVI